MKSIRIFAFCFIITMAGIKANGQHFLSLNGGYSFGSIEDTSANAPGFKISLEYEYLTFYRHFAVGFQTAYHQAKTEKSSNGRFLKFKAVPLAGYLKYYVGKDKLRGYAKGIAGLQTSRYEFEGPNARTQNWDIGFMLGGGLGGTLRLTDKLALVLDYELDWYNNSYYREFTANSVSVGLQLKVD